MHTFSDQIFSLKLTMVIALKMKCSINSVESFSPITFNIIVPRNQSALPSDFYYQMTGLDFFSILENLKNYLSNNGSKYIITYI